MNYDEKVYFGIDLGTNNIGYAATDGNYRLLKAGRKNALGVFVYSDGELKAKSAIDRRLFRTSRRRLDRRGNRITILQELFAKAIAEKDPTFFLRLKENDLRLEDKSRAEKFSLFCDGDYTDRDFYRQYKTIYHLRRDLMLNGTDDVRKLYLAVHHIIKYRGHFLLDGELEGIADVKNLLAELNETIEERNLEIEEIDGANKLLKLSLEGADELQGIFADGKLKKKVKVEKTCKILNVSDKTTINLINAIFGYNFDARKVFGESQYEKDEIESISFDENFDTKEQELASSLHESDFKIVECLKAIYDQRVLRDLLKGELSISDAMIAKYEKHKEDLKKLKKFIKTYAPNKFDDVFGVPLDDKNKLDKGKSNYTQYVGGGRPNGKDKIFNGRLGNTCSKTDFYSFVKKILVTVKAEEAETAKQEILADIENFAFMPKIVSKDNGLLPYQLNMLELDKILNKAMENPEFSWLKEADNYGSVADKIKMLLSFRIPYYVGPIKYYRENTRNASKNAWAERIEDGRVLPWNIEEKIDFSRSEEKFIKRMLNKCTYLKDRFALPMNSIMYSEFIALSELNKLKVNDSLMHESLKNEIWDELYVKKSTPPSVKGIINFLKAKGYEELRLSGYDVNLKGNLKSYHTLKGIIGDKVDTDRAMAERLILLMTVHNEPKILAEAIKTEFGEKLSDDEIKRLKGIKYNGWGRFSKELLDGIAYGGIVLTDAQGERRSIISIMKDTTLNFMEIKNSPQFNFDEALKQYNEEHGLQVSDKITFKDVEEMYCSPSVKRSVWQTFTLIKTLEKELGKRPDKIFIEVTREREDKKKTRTKSRKELLEGYYKEAKNVKNDIYSSDLEQFSGKLSGMDNKDLNPEKIFLYFMQLGRCAYSGKKIDLDELGNCDVDHIIPQALKKDDSLDNKVLVFKDLNSHKSDNYPVPIEYRKDGKNLWEYLYKSKLMSKEKYERLTRQTKLSDEEKRGFINRQLVETGQTALLVRDLLEMFYNGENNKGKPSVEIVLSKAQNVSEFRKVYGFVKSRDVNEFHHAEDAYLNIVVGNVLNEKFGHNKDYESLRAEAAADIAAEKEAEENGERQTNKFMQTFFKPYYSDRDKRYIWNGYNTLKLMREELDTRDYSVSKKTVIKKGELFEATVYKATKWNPEDVKNTAKYTMQESKKDDNGNELHPKSNPEFYGFKKASGTAYFAVVDSDGKKGKTRRSIEAISIIDDRRIQSGKKTLEDAVKEKGLKNARLADIKGLKQPIIKVGELVEYGSTKLRLSGKTDDRITFHNANQFYAPKNIVRYIKELSVINGKVLENVRTVSSAERDDKEEAELKLLEADKTRRLNEAKNKKTDIVFITPEANLRIYDFFVEKINKKPYSDIPGYDATIELLNNARESFEKLRTFKQLNVLLKLISAFQCNAKFIDSSDLYYYDKDRIKRGAPSGGKIKTSKFIEDKKMKLILQSKTGLKEKVIELN